ncbi:Hypothetical predicted protein [Lecanosticta acicola]|uniref:Uncharacterized protein n=1 Tax=Lecanosticta acicola TaxID=111012 RepID=A0AAI8YZH5_9PEZI|nr:Hypothetical predicted protein [Lecanosticta acicola]
MSDTTRPPLSQREQEILLLAWGHCLEEKPKVDYDKLATLLGSKSVASAAKTYQNALKKLTSGAGIAAAAATTGGGGGGGGGGDSDEGKAAGGSKTKKRAASTAAEKNKKKPRAKKARVEVAATEEGEAEGEMEEVIKDEEGEGGEEEFL